MTTAKTSEATAEISSKADEASAHANEVWEMPDKVSATLNEVSKKADEDLESATEVPEMPDEVLRITNQTTNAPDKNAESKSDTTKIARKHWANNESPSGWMSRLPTAPVGFWKAVHEATAVHFPPCSSSRQALSQRGKKFDNAHNSRWRGAWALGITGAFWERTYAAYERTFPTEG